MTRRTDWATAEARRVMDVVQNGSRDVSVGYLASVLRMAHQRGAIEAGAKAVKPAPEKLV